MRNLLIAATLAAAVFGFAAPAVAEGPACVIAIAKARADFKEIEATVAHDLNDKAARAFAERLGAPEVFVDRVARVIIYKHSPRLPMATPFFAIAVDANGCVFAGRPLEADELMAALRRQET